MSTTPNRRQQSQTERLPAVKQVEVRRAQTATPSSRGGLRTQQQVAARPMTRAEARATPKKTPAPPSKPMTLHQRRMHSLKYSPYRSAPIDPFPGRKTIRHKVASPGGPEHSPRKQPTSPPGSPRATQRSARYLAVRRHLPAASEELMLASMYIAEDPARVAAFKEFVKKELKNGGTRKKDALRYRQNIGKAGKAVSQVAARPLPTEREKHGAATKIQRTARGRSGRKRFARIKKEKEQQDQEAAIEQRIEKEVHRRLVVADSLRRIDEIGDAKAATTIQSAARSRLAKKQVEEKRRNKAATNIQRVSRGRQARKKVAMKARDKRENAAAVSIQRVARGKQGRARVAKIREEKAREKAEEEARERKKREAEEARERKKREAEEARLAKQKREEEEEQAKAAVGIQAAFRGKAARAKLAEEKEAAKKEPVTPSESAHHIQKVTRGFLGRRQAALVRTAASAFRDSVRRREVSKMVILTAAAHFAQSQQPPDSEGGYSLVAYAEDLHDAREAVKKVDQECLDKFAAEESPSKFQAGVAACVCVALRQEPTWASTRRLVARDDFKELITTADPTKLSVARLKVAGSVFMQHNLPMACQESRDEFVVVMTRWLIAFLGPYTVAAKKIDADQAPVEAEIAAATVTMGQRSVRVLDPKLFTLAHAKSLMAKVTHKEMMEMCDVEKPKEKALVTAAAATAVMFNRNPSWVSARSFMLSGKFSEAVDNLQPSDLTMKQALVVRRLIDRNHFQETVADKSKPRALRFFAEWVMSVATLCQQQVDAAREASAKREEDTKAAAAASAGTAETS